MIRIVSAEPLAKSRLRVTSNDGATGIFPVEPERRGGVFLRLLDARIFNTVTINPDFGCVEWSGGIDLCPETMHRAITVLYPRLPRTQRQPCAKIPGKTD